MSAMRCGNTSSQRGQPCTMIICSNNDAAPEIQKWRKIIMGGVTDQITDVLKKIIICILNGEHMVQLMMPIIRFVLPLKDRTIRKLLLLYWEVVEKRNTEGQLLQEMILVCNSLMNDLNHPNEYIRGSTLRFLCKLREPELIEPLIESIKSNLQQRHSYVRRNAILAIYSIYKEFPSLIPDAGTLVSQFLSQETEASCQRNAFMMLFNTHPDLAYKYLCQSIGSISTCGETLQMMMLQMIKRFGNPSKNGSSPSNMIHVDFPVRRLAFLRVVFSLISIQIKSPSVNFDAAMTLLQLSRVPSAITAACKALLTLMRETSDNNIRMVVLEQVLILVHHRSATRSLQPLAIDVLRILNSSLSLELVHQVLNIVLELLTPQNVNEVATFLKSELTKSHSQDYQHGGKYRLILVQTLRQFAVKYPDITAQVLMEMFEFLSDVNPETAYDVSVFLRDVLVSNPKHRFVIITKLLDDHYLMDHIYSAKVWALLAWIFGEYLKDDVYVYKAIRLLGGLLIGQEEVNKIHLAKDNEIQAPTSVHDANSQRHDERHIPKASTHTKSFQGEQSGTTGANSEHSMPHYSQATKASTNVHILADGSYATQCPETAFSISDNTGPSTEVSSNSDALVPGVHSGTLAITDYLFACTLATSLTKLAIHAQVEQLRDASLCTARIILMLVRFVRLCNQNDTDRVSSTQSSTSPSSSHHYTSGHSASSKSEVSSTSPLVNMDNAFNLLRFNSNAHTPSHITSLGSPAVLSLVDPDSQDWILRCIQLLLGPNNTRTRLDFLGATQQTSKKALNILPKDKKQTSSHDAQESSRCLLSLIPVDVFLTSPLLGGNISYESNLTGLHREDAEEQLKMIIDPKFAVSSSLSLRSLHLAVTADVMGASCKGSNSISNGIDNIGDIRYSYPLNQPIKSPLGIDLLSSLDTKVRHFQLTGLSDRLYAEATLTVQQYTMQLDLTIVNRTDDTLQNVVLELLTLHTLKFTTTSYPQILGPHSTLVLTSYITASTTQAASIFSAINYSISPSHMPEYHFVVFAEMRIDMIDFLQPSWCDEHTFRTKWQAFEWDTKISINTESDQLASFLRQLQRTTNMCCITEDPLQFSAHGFLAANFHACSMYGEHALANLSVQARNLEGNDHKTGDNPEDNKMKKIQGFIRIRSQTQGLADLLYAKIIQNLNLPIKNQ